MRTIGKSFLWVAVVASFLCFSGCLTLPGRNQVVYSETFRQEVYLRTIFNHFWVCGGSSQQKCLCNIHSKHRTDHGKTDSFKISSPGLPSGTITVPGVAFSVDNNRVEVTYMAPLDLDQCDIANHAQRGVIQSKGEMYAVVDVLAELYADGRVSAKVVQSFLKSRDTIEVVQPCKAVEM